MSRRILSSSETFAHSIWRIFSHLTQIIDDWTFYKYCTSLYSSAFNNMSKINNMNCLMKSGNLLVKKFENLIFLINNTINISLCHEINCLDNFYYLPSAFYYRLHKRQEKLYAHPLQSCQDFFFFCFFLSIFHIFNLPVCSKRNRIASRDTCRQNVCLEPAFVR